MPDAAEVPTPDVDIDSSSSEEPYKEDPVLMETQTQQKRTNNVHLDQQTGGKKARTAPEGVVFPEDPDASSSSSRPVKPSPSVTSAEESAAPGASSSSGASVPHIDASVSSPTAPLLFHSLMTRMIRATQKPLGMTILKHNFTLTRTLQHGRKAPLQKNFCQTRPRFLSRSV